MMERNYWVVSPNVKNNGEENDWKEFLSINPYSFIAWDDDNRLGKIFIHDVKRGDVIINCQRKKWEACVFGIGIVKTDECRREHIEGAPSKAYCRRLYSYIPKERISNLNLDFEGTACYGNNKQIRAIYRLHPERNENDKNLVEIIEEELKKEENMDKLVDLLKCNHSAPLFVLTKIIFKKIA